MGEFLFNWQTSLIWLCIVWGLNIIIFTPYILLNTYWFYKHRRNTFIAKRRVSLVIILIIIILFTINISRPLLSFNQLYHVISIKGNYLIFWGDSTIFLLSTFLFCRVWKLFYDFKEEEKLLDLKWMRIIRSHKLYIPWTVKYKFIGNVKGLILLSFLLYIILFTAIVLINSYTNNPLFITITICAVLLILISIITYPFIAIFKTVHDYYQIYKELRILFINSCIILIIFIIDILPHTNKYIDSLIMYTLITFALVPLALIQTKWVLYKEQRFLSHVNNRRIHGSIVLGSQLQISVPMPRQNTNTVHSQTRTLSISKPNSRQTSEQSIQKQATTTLDFKHSLKLEDILKTEKGFKIFANHLVRELTVEHLLYILEVMQLKHEMLKYELMTISQIGWIIQFPHQITGNSIELTVINDIQVEKAAACMMSVFTYTDVLDDFQYLCTQYINVDAEHSLNLSSRIRKKLMDKTMEYSKEFNKLKLDKLHLMTSNKHITPQSPNTPLPIEDYHSGDNYIDDDAIFLSVGHICPTIRFGHLSDVMESDFEDFVDNNDNGNQVVDHINHTQHSFHYNVNNANVLKMKIMIEDLINSIDKSLVEVYRLIERDSYQRFTNTHDYIALEKLLYKINRKESGKQSQSLNLNGVRL